MSENLNSLGRNLADSVGSYTRCEDGSNAHDSPPELAGSLEAPSDADLLHLISVGRTQALEALYGRYSDAVFSLVRYILRDDGMAEEVTQDTFLNAWRSASSYVSRRGKVSSWLFSIAHHRAIDELRRRHRREKGQVHREVELAGQPSGEGSDPYRYTVLQLQRGRVREALLELPPEQREVVTLAFYRGLTHSEIAKSLRKPLGTVKTRMRLALRKLRKALEPQVEEWTGYGL